MLGYALASLTELPYSLAISSWPYAFTMDRFLIFLF